VEKQFAVIGLGRFGISVCQELYAMGHDVLAIDRSEEKVEFASDYATKAIVANGVDERTLKALGIRNFDYVVVAIGEHIQESVLATLLLKELGVSNVWVKASNAKHYRILEKVGADRIIRPEHEMGIRIAHLLDSTKVIDYIELSDEHSIVELAATEKIANKTIAQLNIRKKYHCTLIGYKRNGQLNIHLSPEEVIYENDLLILAGENSDLKRFEKKGLS
jgi:trk system potassium uptake protein